MITITRVRANWPEKQGFELNREDTGNEYIFIHFVSNAKIGINEETFEVKPGACILYASHSRQYLSVPDNPLLHDWFHVTGEVDPILQKYQFHPNTVYYPDSPSSVSGIIQAIEFECLQNKAYATDICFLKFQELIALIARSRLSFDSSTSFSHQEELANLRRQLCLHYAKDWNTNKMASLVHLSPAHFYRIYHEVFGRSPGQDLQGIRMEHAQSLLESGSYTISEIAEFTGYKSTFHFIRQFRNTFGISPGKYKKNLLS